MQYGPLTILAGNSVPEFSKSLAESLGQRVGAMDLRRFRDGECFVEVQENVRGRDVFIIQSTCPPVNENLMEVLVILDACKRASADRITVVLPYFGYARQDRKTSGRTPISARLVASLLERAGAHRVLALDLHAGQIQGFFDIPVDHLYATPAFLAAVRDRWTDSRKLVVISPDAGGVERSLAYAKRLGVPLAVCDKRRAGAGKVEQIRVIGDVEGRYAIIFDDIVDSAGTLKKAAEALKKAGAIGVSAVCTHAVLSDPAVENVTSSALDTLFVSDSIPLRPNAAACKKIEVVSVAELLGEAVRRIHHGDSVSMLFGQKS
ncbi:MAG: ribose-phosphate pyrophosphokinase [Deltaproteobacteria bacterium]|nr:ribose-phosphate pyrophosphokinase [Deltaproteobacteria bacterium]